MLVIRLQRTGRRNAATYRLVLAEKRKPVKGGVIEMLGYYLPAQNPKQVKIETERVEHWINKGAVPSNTVARLLKKNGLKDMEKFMETYAKKRSKKAPPEEPAAPPAPAAAPAAEASAEAAPAPEAAPEPAAEAPAEPAPEAPAAEGGDSEKKE